MHRYPGFEFASLDNLAKHVALTAILDELVKVHSVKTEEKDERNQLQSISDDIRELVNCFSVEVLIGECRELMPSFAREFGSGVFDLDQSYILRDSAKDWADRVVKKVEGIKEHINLYGPYYRVTDIKNLKDLHHVIDGTISTARRMEEVAHTFWLYTQKPEEIDVEQIGFGLGRIEELAKETGNHFDWVRQKANQFADSLAG